MTGATPYEAWTKVKPEVGYLKIFGCLAYMKVPHVHTTKLDNRSKCVIHLGREAGTKAYRLYDPISRNVHISRDVVFDESKSWQWNNFDNGSISPSFVLAGSQFSDSYTAENDDVENDDAEFQSPRSHQSPLVNESDSAVITSYSQASSSTESGGTLSHTARQLEFDL